MRLATSPGRISSTKKMISETRSSVSSESRIRVATSFSIDKGNLRFGPHDQKEKRPDADPEPASGRGSSLLAAAQIFKVQVEVLRPRRVALAALAQGQDLVDEHRDDDAAFLGQQLAGLLEQLLPLRVIDRGVG